jgi:hypothetical protein
MVSKLFRDSVAFYRRRLFQSNETCRCAKKFFQSTTTPPHKKLLDDIRIVGRAAWAKAEKSAELLKDRTFI